MSGRETGCPSMLYDSGSPSACYGVSAVALSFWYQAR
jgi:hypothetical protein